MPVIYLDVLLALNLFIDFLLLSAVARILRLPCKRFRLVLGAVAGSIFSAALFLPPMPAAVSMLIKIASACIIVKIAFKWQSLNLYIKQLAVFLISSALFGGLAFAIWFFAAPSGFYVVNGVVYYNVSPLMLTVLTVASYLIISLYDRLTHKRMALGQEYKLTLDCGNGPFELRALYDTGHHVTDVFSGKPVAIVRFGAIEQHLPENLRDSVFPLLDFNKLSPKGENIATAAVTKIRMIPVKTVNGTGLLPAFCPSKMVLSSSGGKTADITGCFVAACQILGRGEYDAIIGTDMINILEGSSIKCSRQSQN